MTEPWETIGATAFGAYVNSLDFTKSGGKPNVERKCKPASAPECNNGKTKVSIDPEEWARELDPGRLDPKGHVIARLVNTGNAMESKYSIPARATVYWLVTPTTAGAPGVSRFVYFDAAGTRTTLSTFPYSQCTDGVSHPNTGRETSFGWCKNDPRFLASPNGEEPAWISCLVGCCIAEVT